MSLLEEHLFQSASSVTLLGAVVFLFVLYLLSSGTRERRKEPPGPRPLPLLGNLLQLDLSRLQLHTSLCHLSKKYGPVFTIHLGPKKMVVLAGYKTVKQALVNYAEEFGDFWIPPLGYDWSKGHGIIGSNGESFKEMRRFAFTNLRGMGKRKIEEKIIQECHYLIDTIEKHEGKAFDSTQAVNYAAANVISAIVYGDRFEYTDPVFQAMVDGQLEAIRLTGSAPVMVVYSVFPWLGPWMKTRRLLIDIIERNSEEMRRLIRALHETLNPQMLRGFIDSFLMRKKGLEDSGIMDSHYHDDNLLYSVQHLFLAGTHTTSSTIRWGLLLMAKYPHIQDRVQEELSVVTGSRQVLAEDRKKLPYTDAVIHEIQRVANIVPLTPHLTSQDVTFQGYFIKKGTPVIPLFTSVLNDETEWESPHTFNPNNFLDQEGQFVKRDAFMAFSAGRKACPGESLAKMEVFLFLTSLLQRFRFSPPPGLTEDELDLTPAVGFTLDPSPHQLCAVARL